MNDPDKSSQVLIWFRYAREDLSAAEATHRERLATPRHVCWLAQQAAEKAIKAALIHLQTDFPRTHDLDLLRNLLPDDWGVREAASDLAALSEWAVEARYPGNWPEATAEDADNALREASEVLDAVATDLEKRGAL